MKQIKLDYCNAINRLRHIEDIWHKDMITLKEFETQSYFQLNKIIKLLYRLTEEYK